MPHFGLMNDQELSPADAALTRSRLHIRGGRRRLRQGKIAAGLATLYDALGAAMRWYLLTHAREANPPEDERELFALLKRLAVLERDSDFDRFETPLQQALAGALPDSFDHQAYWHDAEQLFRRLGVMPFDEDSLPPEDPATF